MDERTSLGAVFSLMARERPDRIEPRNFKCDAVLQLEIQIDGIAALKLEKYLKELLNDIIGVRVLQIDVREVER